MSKKKELDKLSLDMIECEKAGYGCHYGKWKAMQEEQQAKKKQEIPDGWRVCEWCGKLYKPKTKRPQKYCEPHCQIKAFQHRNREKNAQYMREWKAKQKGRWK